MTALTIRIKRRIYLEGKNHAKSRGTRKCRKRAAASRKSISSIMLKASKLSILYRGTGLFPNGGTLTYGKTPWAAHISADI
jgi:hypothetical protein